MSATQLRDLAMKLAASDPARALSTAQAIKDPWFACQALAGVARYAPDSQFSKIVQESLRVVRGEVDRYRVVAPAAWPIRAIVERNRLEMLPSIVPELLHRADEIKLFASRSEALFLLFQAIFPGGRENWLPVLESLQRASTPLMSWRQRRNLLDAVMIVRGDDEALALQIMNSVADEKLKRKMERTWATSEPRLPRPFFWTRDA